MADNAEVTISVATETPQKVQLVFADVSVDVPVKGDDGKPTTKRILDSVSGIFGPSEAWAVMGPSGSGKTTMLNALTGVTKPTSGTITVNNQAFNLATMRQVSAFVPQDDLLTPCLTVHEALMEAALFKTGLPIEDREARVTALLSQFGLHECRDVLIGHPEGRKGISVALELCGNPSLLYLDEPTSGLDAVSTMALVRQMSSLAASGVTVIATIHQPSAAAFYTFDRLLLLNRGQICYQGPVTLGAQPVAFFTAAGFQCPPLENPADYMFECLVEHASTIRELYLKGEAVPEDSGRSADSGLAPVQGARSAAAAYPATLASQMRMHVRRNLIAMSRDPLLARLRVGSACGVGLVIGILFYKIDEDATGVNEIISLLLFSMLFLAIINALPVVIAILPEFAIVHKECRNHWYSPWAYVPAKLITEMPLLIVPPLLFLTIMGNMTTLTWQTSATSESDCSRFFMLYLAILLVVVATNAWAFLLSGLAPTTEIAILITPGSIMPMALLSGFFINQQDMPWVFRWFTYVDYLNYSWQALATAGFMGRHFDVPPGLGLSTGDDILQTRLNLPDMTGSTVGNYWANIGILIGFTIVFRILATIIVARRLGK